MRMNTPNTPAFRCATQLSIPTDKVRWVPENVNLELSSFACRANIDRFAQLCQAGLGDGDVVFRFAAAKNGE